MAKKTSKIIQQKAPPKKEPLGSGAKLGIGICILVVSALAFAFAERLGLTGTHFLFKGETVIQDSASATREDAQADQPVSVQSKKSVEKQSGNQTSSGKKSEGPDKKSSNGNSGKKSAPKKKASSKKAKTPVQPLPLAAFVDISRKPHTWPGFIRTTRSRTISMTDPQTGASMGRMEIPSGTVVKIIKVLPTGTLEVFDRTGQKFQVEASGTNFAAAYAAVKNKPKKKSKPKKAVAKSEGKPEPQPVVVARPEPAEKNKSATSPAMSAFGVVAEDDEGWDDADYE